MDYTEAKITHLAIEAPGKPKTFVRTFATKPNKNLLTTVGKLFGVIEIRSNHERIPDLIDVIVDELKNNYYSQKTAKPDQPLPNIVEEFELALKKTNLAIASFIKGEQIELDFSKVNICIAVSHAFELHFSFVGATDAMLFYNTAKNAYRIINISESNQVGMAGADPMKLFSQIISGSMRMRDILFMTTSNLLDYFSVERIKNIMTAGSTAEGVSQLNQLIEQINSRENFATLVAELNKVTLTPKIAPVIQTNSEEEFDYVKAASRDSIRQLMKTEKETERLLTPSAMPEMKKYISSVKSFFANIFREVQSKSSDFISSKTRSATGRLTANSKLRINATIEKFGGLGGRAKTLLAPMAYRAKSAGGIIKRIPFADSVWIRLRDIWQKQMTKFRQLPQSSRRLLIVAASLGLLFAVSLIWIGVKNSQTKQLEQFNQTIVDATRQKDNAESSLIYRDENQARQSLISARDMVMALRPSSKSQQEQTQILLQEINDQLLKLQHIVDIADPVQIVNVQNFDSQAQLAPAAALLHGQLIIPNQNGSAIYKVNVDRRTAAVVNTAAISPGTFIAATVLSDKELLLLTNAATAFIYNQSNDSLKKAAISFKPKNAVPDLSAFHGRVYVLDTTDNQIYRSIRTANTFGAPTPWLKNGAESVIDGVSLTVDGSVYVAKSSGEILKFDNGNVSSFRLNVVDPLLKSPTKIKTFDNSKYLYVLDATNERIIVFDKQGVLISQYHSEMFNDLKDFTVDEPNKKIYVVSGTSVYGIPAEHLK